MDDTLIKVIATKTIVSCGCLHLDLRLAIHLVNLKHGYIECTATEIEHENRLVVFLVDTVSQCGCCWFVDDSQNLKTSDATGILCGLALSIGEVCRTCDDRLLDLMAKIGFSVSLQLL